MCIIMVLLVLTVLLNKCILLNFIIIRSAVTMILLLGPFGSGKSTLVSVLMQNQDSSKAKSSKNDHDFEELPSVLPTVGTNITQLTTGRKMSVEIRELGGAMAPIWHSYYKDATRIIYVIDASNVLQISNASVGLKGVVSSPVTQNTPILVVFNKIDVPSKTSINEIKYLSQVDYIKQESSQPISVIETSCKDKTGLNDITKWLHLKKSIVK